MTTATTLYRPAYDLEVRSSGDGRTLAGIAVPFDSPATIPTSPHTSYTEVFKRGAFARTINNRGHKIRLQVMHDQHTRLPIGAATLLREDAAGLYGEFRVSRTSQGDEILELIRDGALDALSIGFRPVRDEWNRDRSQVTRLEVALREVSVVTEPAYDGARILALRDGESRLDTEVARRRLNLYR